MLSLILPDSFACDIDAISVIQVKLELLVFVAWLESECLRSPPSILRHDDITFLDVFE